jgi:peptide/nickel transport system ATP-binding protein
LVGIPGTAVAPGERPPGCPFEPRCDHRVPVCAEAMPPRELVAGPHEVRCFRWRELSLEAADVTPHSFPRDQVGEPLLAVRDLVATYERRRQGGPAAVSGVSFTVGRRECLAIVGESGSGKTTVARCLAGLHVPTSGAIVFDGRPLEPAARERPVGIRRQIQLVFQNPDSSLNPRQTVRDIVTRPFRQFFGVSQAVADAKAAELLQLVRLPARLTARYPGELSGGEKQRVAIARALAADPARVVCDEITSALDVSVQAAILDLLGELRARLETSFLFISHDLAVVRSIADRIVVMHDGEIVEEGVSEDIFTSPQADYTRRLLEAVPSVTRAVGSDSPWTLASG